MHSKHFIYGYMVSAVKKEMQETHIYQKRMKVQVHVVNIGSCLSVWFTDVLYNITVHCFILILFSAYLNKRE